MQSRFRPYRDGRFASNPAPRWRALRREFIVTGTALLLLGTVVAVLYWQDRRFELRLREQQAQHRLDLGRQLIARDIDAVRADILFLAGQSILERFASGQSNLRTELEGEYARFAEQRRIFDQIRFLDLLGQERIRVNFTAGEATVVPADQLQLKDDRYYYQAATGLSPGSVFVSEFDLNIEHGQIERPFKPVLRFVTPIDDSSGQRQGYLVLNYLGANLLDSLNALASPGKTLLLRPDGSYLLGLNPEDAWGWLSGQGRSFPAQFPRVWRQLDGRMQGELLSSDGYFAFRSVALGYPLPQGMVLDDARRSGIEQDSELTSLVLSAYLNPAEVFAQSSKLLWQLLSLAGGAALVVFGLVRVWSRSVDFREAQAAQIALSESRLRTLSSQLLSAQEVERRSLSRDLHDELGQQATAILLDLQSAQRESDRQRLGEVLQRAAAEMRQLLESLHQIASKVRPAVLDDLGLHDAVESLLADFGHRTSIPVESRLDFDAVPISPAIGENVFRILQEALTNIAKHARATSVGVELIAQRGAVSLSVWDDGVGFDVDRPLQSRLGLLGMRERAELLHGEFRIDSAPGRGTRIDVRLRPGENQASLQPSASGERR